MALLELTENGLFCPSGGFAIDPWKPVDLAVITHGHGDHARPGSKRVVTASAGAPILERRIGGEGVAIEGLDFGEPRRFGKVEVSLHPAGHVLGSAQVRVSDGAQTWVVSGDYKRDPDPTCAPFEPVPCDVFVTEATFALPIYRWAPPAEVVREIRDWWREGAEAGEARILYAYVLGKAQRILAELHRLGDLPDETVWVHGAIENMTRLYRDAGVAMVPTAKVADRKEKDWAGKLVLAPPSVRRSPWLRRFGKAHESALASGWMQLRGTRRGRGLARGFVLSDHADWPSLLRTVKQSGAERVLCTHGFGDTLARHLREQGIDAAALATEWTGEEGAET